MFAKAETSSTLQQAQYIAVPIKVHVFVDGTWVYYSCVKGRERDCPIKSKFGEDWPCTHRIDWPKIAKFIIKNLELQLRASNSSLRPVEITRTSVFTSSRADTHEHSMRSRMIEEWQNCNFEVHHYETSGLQEKCVDIALAVEMLYGATIQGAYDIACIVTGDKDFIPVLQKTRMAGKLVALCSLRNSCNNDLIRPDVHVRDFDPIWIDNYLDELVVTKGFTRNSDQRDVILMSAIKQFIDSKDDSMASSRDLGRLLKDLVISSSANPICALEYVKTKYFSLWKYFTLYDDIYLLHGTDDGLEFSVSYRDEQDSVITEEDYDDSDSHKIGNRKSTWSSASEEIVLGRKDAIHSLKQLLKEKRPETSTESLGMLEAADIMFEELSRSESIDSCPDSWLLQHILTFLENEKIASFSDVGRMLNMESSDIPGINANQRMKDLYGNLRTYLLSQSNTFVVSAKNSHRGVLDYLVSCRRCSPDFNTPTSRSCKYDDSGVITNPFIDDDEELKEERPTPSSK